ncbi:hypothetical protein BDY21DRAFT_399760 [Lineolata rhizophorae]|uniref:Armadillo repeat-containing protein 8 n=1 Tax=Lineolata rhizophorae TaxID=578093 RepID=A0A6A6NSB7_9PEZI|nr:hypothetical protein BDY21DRAFT_399760 [Lineolata rhizophorae]
MPHPSRLPVLADLRAAATPEELVAALRRLKNDIVGHDQRKEAVLRSGAVRPLIEVLRGATKASGKRRRDDDVGAGLEGMGSDIGGMGPGFEGGSVGRGVDGGMEWTVEMEQRLQATLILGSLAQGGPSYVAPLVHGGALPNLLDALSPRTTPPRLIIATLRTLVTFADAARLDAHKFEPADPLDRQALADEFYDPIHADRIECYADILSQSTSAGVNNHGTRSPSSATPAQITTQVGLLLELLCKTIIDDRHRSALARCGVLDLLAARLAALIVSSGHTLPGANPVVLRVLPTPAPPRRQLSRLLEAIATVISGSNYRAARFIYSPVILAIFPAGRCGGGDHGGTGSPRTLSSSIDATQQRQKSHAALAAVNRLLPQLQVVGGSKTVPVGPRSDAFPALQSLGSAAQAASIGLHQQQHNGGPDDGAAGVAGGLGARPGFPRLLSSSSSPLGDAAPHPHLHAQSTRTISADAFESPLFGWLIHVARSEAGIARLNAAWLLALCARVLDVALVSDPSEAGQGGDASGGGGGTSGGGGGWSIPDPTSSKNRDRALAMLVVPLVVRMVEDAYAAEGTGHANGDSHEGLSASPSLAASPSSDVDLATQVRLMRERAPGVLAQLIGESTALQRAAFDAGIVKRLCKVLKKTFEPANGSGEGGKSDRASSGMWSPTPRAVREARSGTNRRRAGGDADDDDEAGDLDAVLGDAGLAPEVLHAFRCRETVLSALAAIADKEDAFRKAIIGENSQCITCIMESLTPYPRTTADQGAAAAGDTIVESTETTRDTVPQLQQPGVETTATVLRRTKPQRNSRTVTAAAKDGNPVAVLVAACHATRAMSRSVSILRTSLMDVSIAGPILALLAHEDTDAVIAATEVLCNLLLHFSPMREPLITKGVITMLCRQAHCANADIRLISLWALKHLILSATNEVKMATLDELGPGWLVQTVAGSDALPGDSVGGVADPMTMKAQPVPTLGTPNAAGEQVDLLNASEPRMDVDDASTGYELFENPLEGVGDSDDDMSESTGDLRGRPQSSSLPATGAAATGARPRKPLGAKQQRQPTPLFHQSDDIGRVPALLAPLPPLPAPHRARLHAVLEAEASPARRARNGEARIQEQALDFVRNFMSENGPLQPRMVDHMLDVFGKSRFFDIMAAKLETRTIGGGAGSSAGGNAGGTKRVGKTATEPQLGSASPAPAVTGHQLQQTQPQLQLVHPPEIAYAALFVLVHVANGTPAQRSLVLAQPRLLARAAPLFAHASRRIRVACVWLAYNLAWADDAADAPSAAHRALELRRCGFADAVRARLQDPELDVRERAKSAVELMSRLGEQVGQVVRGGGGDAGAGGGGGDAGGNNGGGAGEGNGGDGGTRRSGAVVYGGGGPLQLGWAR